MSSPKFLVFKLKDLRIPALIVLIVAALLVFLMFKNKATQTFAPSDGYLDGKYIAGITLSDAEMDVIVEVANNNIVSISLSGLDENSSSLYKDLVSGIDYVNTYVTATQSLELPQNANSNSATMLLMDAVKVALSDDQNASITTSYEKVNLTTDPTTDAQVATTPSDENTAEDIFVDEFQEEDFSADTTDSDLSDTTLSDINVIQ